MLQIFGAVLLLAGLVAVGVGVYLGWVESRYASDGVVVEGVVTGTQFVPGGEDSDPEYRVEYRFTPRGGEPTDGRSEVDEGTYDDADAGDVVEIQYLRGEPSTNRVNGTGGWLWPAFAAGLGGIGIMSGSLLLVIAWRSAMAERRLMREGIATPALVVGHEVTNYSVNEVDQWKVVYQFTDAAGRTHLGRSPHLSPEDAHRWQPGTSVMIRYDPFDPTRSVWMAG